MPAIRGATQILYVNIIDRSFSTLSSDINNASRGNQRWSHGLTAGLIMKTILYTFSKLILPINTNLHFVMSFLLPKTGWITKVNTNSLFSTNL